jgi:hypothetical protein
VAAGTISGPSDAVRTSSSTSAASGEPSAAPSLSTHSNCLAPIGLAGPPAHADLLGVSSHCDDIVAEQARPRPVATTPAVLLVKLDCRFLKVRAVLHAARRIGAPEGAMTDREAYRYLQHLSPAHDLNPDSGAVPLERAR